MQNIGWFIHCISGIQMLFSTTSLKCDTQRFNNNGQPVFAVQGAFLWCRCANKYAFRNA